MDNMDEFEFKPLTEGLGFHKKQTKANNLASYDFKEDKREISQIDTKDIASLGVVTEPKQERANPFLNSPLPRENKFSVPKFESRKFAASPQPMPLRREPPVPSIPISRTPFKKDLVETKTADLPLMTKKPFDFDSVQFIPTVGHIGAYFFDLIVTVGVACLFAMSLMIFGDIDIFKVLSTITFDIGMQLGTGLLIASVLVLYLVLSRSFFGSTLGEWVFDMQLGKPQNQNKIAYPIRVFWRSLIVLLTGVVTIPLLSLIARKDLAASFSGLELYKR